MRNNHTAITTHGYTSYVIRPSCSGSVRDERQQSTQIIVRLLTQAQLAGWGPLPLMRVYWLCSKSGCRHSGPPPASRPSGQRQLLPDISLTLTSTGALQDGWWLILDPVESPQMKWVGPIKIGSRHRASQEMETEGDRLREREKRTAEDKRRRSKESERRRRDKLRKRRSERERESCHIHCSETSV